MPKIVVIGAGSAIFGTGVLATLLRSRQLRGAELGLCDINGAALETMHRLAERMNDAWDAGVHAVAVPPLPPAVTEICRREAELAALVVEAAATGDRSSAPSTRPAHGSHGQRHRPLPRNSRRFSDRIPRVAATVQLTTSQGKARIHKSIHRLMNQIWYPS